MYTQRSKRLVFLDFSLDSTGFQLQELLSTDYASLGGICPTGISRTLLNVEEAQVNALLRAQDACERKNQKVLLPQL
jgi:uncharacterized protein YaaQ